MLNRSNMKWIRLHAPEGSIIFNAGDYLQRITNDGEAAEGQEHQEGEGTVSVYMVSVCMYRCIAPRSFRLSLSLSLSRPSSLSLSLSMLLLLLAPRLPSLHVHCHHCHRCHRSAPFVPVRSDLCHVPHRDHLRPHLRWPAGCSVIPSTTHRVTLPPRAQWGVPRTSFPMAVYLNEDVVLEPLKCCGTTK